MTVTESRAGVANKAGAPPMSSPCAAAAKTFVAPAAAAGLGGAYQRAAGADEVVDDDRDLAGYVARQQFAGHHAAAAILLHVGAADVAPGQLLQRLPERLGPLGAARIGRDGDGRLAMQKRREMRGEQRRDFDVHGRAAERVLERRDVMHFDRHDAIDPDRVEHRSDIARGDGVVGLGAPVLAGIAEIRDDGGDASGTRVFQRAAEEQHAAELVVAAGAVVAVQRMQHERVLAAHILQRPCLVLAVFEVTLLVLGERDVEALCDTLREVAAAVQPEQQHRMVGHRPSSWLAAAGPASRACRRRSATSASEICVKSR